MMCVYSLSDTSEATESSLSDTSEATELFALCEVLSV